MHTTDVLPSWNDTATRRVILSFVDDVTTEGSSTFIPPDERIAVFDNDGTLWPEKPIVAQLAFTIQRFAEMAEADTALRVREPYQSAWRGEGGWLDSAVLEHYAGDDAKMKLLLAEVPRAFAGMTIEDYLTEAKQFVQTVNNPHFGVTHDQLGYLPMIELLHLLAARGFTSYIASGGERDFMRSFAETMYGIPPERIIGSALKLAFEEFEDHVRIVYRPELHVFDDGDEKPKSIWDHIGRRPVIVGGNSNGDIAMLRVAHRPDRPSLRLVVKHDDATREFADERGAEALLARAVERDWTVISMRDDWNRIFAHQQQQTDQ